MALKKNNVTLLYASVRALHPNQIHSSVEARATWSRTLLYCGVQQSGGRGHKVRLMLVQSLRDSRNRRVSDLHLNFVASA